MYEWYMLPFAILLLALVQMYTIYAVVSTRGVAPHRGRRCSPRKADVPAAAGVRVNVPTRGLTHYNQMGILHNGGDSILPLMGRPVHPGSHMWNYYTLTNEAVPIRIPLVNSGRECESSNGCKELYNDDHIFIPELDSRYTVKLYNRAPRYIPYL